MFDFKISKEEKKRQVIDSLNGAAVSTEMLMPFTRIDNGKCRIIDGSTCVYLTFPGRNLSLMTEEEWEEYASKVSLIFSGATANAIGIFWLPERTRSRANLEFCLNRNKDLKNIIYGTNTDIKNKKPYECQLKVMEEYILPDIQGQALSASTVQGKTYIALKFDYATDAEIDNSLRNTLKRINDQIGRPAHFLESKVEVLDFIDLWRTSYAPLKRMYGPQVVLPKF